MIRRMKRQTKKRHSVKAQRVQHITLAAITEPIIGAKFSPDVWKS